MLSSRKRKTRIFLTLFSFIIHPMHLHIFVCLKDEGLRLKKMFKLGNSGPWQFFYFLLHWIPGILNYKKKISKPLLCQRQGKSKNGNFFSLNPSLTRWRRVFYVARSSIFSISGELKKYCIVGANASSLKWKLDTQVTPSCAILKILNAKMHLQKIWFFISVRFIFIQDLQL